MSWKSLLCSGLLCVLVAVPAAADPTLNATLLGLDTDGNWQWQISVSPDAGLFADNPPNGVGGSVAVELGVEVTAGDLINGAATSDFPYENFGNGPAAWGDNIDGVDPNPDEGVAYNAGLNQLVAYLGSEYFTSGGEKPMLLITTDRPSVGSLTTEIETLGAYGVGSDQALIAQAGQNFVVNTTYTRAVRSGNANLDGIINVSDLGILGTNYETSPGVSGGCTPGTCRWQDGDYTGDGHVNVSDLGELGTNYDIPGTQDGSDPNWTTPGSITLTPVVPGAGAGAGTVPEPSTALMLVLGSLLLGLRRARK